MLGSLDSEFSLLLAFVLHVLLCLLEQLTIEFFAFSLVFLAELLAKLDLFVKHVTDLLHFLHLELFLFPNLLFVESLAELLNFTPFIVADV